jgi:hypothetical protein
MIMGTRKMAVSNGAFRRSLVVVAIATQAVGWDGTASASPADELACARLAFRMEKPLRRRQDKCLQTAANRDARGQLFDVEACETKVRAAYAARLAARGCTTEESTDESHSHRAGVLVRGPVVLNGEVQERSYEIVDGQAILEGDIMLGPVDADGFVIEPVEEETPPLDPDDPEAAVSARSITLPSSGWSGNVIPYVLDLSIWAGLSDEMAALNVEIESAIRHWNLNTIVQLKPRGRELDFVRFTLADEYCWSSFGRKGGRQDIRLSLDCKKGSVIHEIGHAVGLLHEHNRYDRGRYVVPEYDNVIQGFAQHFEVYPLGFGVDRGRFDFGSIMLYGSFDFSNGNGPTLTRLDGTTFTAQRNGLSVGDVVGATMLITRPGAALKKFRNAATGLCLSSNGTGYQAWCSASDSWYWYRNPVTAQNQIINARTGLCLYAPSGSNGSLVHEGTCRNIRQQQFVKHKYDAARSRMLIRNLSSNLCLEIGPTTSGTRLRQSPCADFSKAGQTWTEQVSSPTAVAR